MLSIVIKTDGESWWLFATFKSYGMLVFVYIVYILAGDTRLAGCRGTFWLVLLVYVA